MEVATIVTLAGAIGGAASGLAGYIQDGINNMNYYNTKLAQLETDKNLALSNLLLDFENAQKEANKNANRSDRQSTINEKYLSTDTNNALETLQLGQVLQGLQFNEANADIGRNTGNALSQLSVSGTRAGGSLSDAVKMEAANNSAQLQATEDYQRKSNDIQLSNILNNLNNNVFGIQENRTDAYDLRESFNEGGYQRQKYENAQKSVENGYDAQKYEYENARAQYEYWNGFWGGLTTMLSFGAKGAQSASKVYDFTNDHITNINYDVGWDKTNKRLTFNKIG